MNDMNNQTSTNRPILVAEHLVKVYGGPFDQKVYATNDISMEIMPGKLIILKGRSGSGKTTLINQLSGLDAPTSGRVLFDGQDYSKLSKTKKDDLRRLRMGFVFQSVALIPIMSAYENIDLSMRLAEVPGDHKPRIMELLRYIGLQKRGEQMATQLSGGEQQRIAIARALAHRPAVLFADEPTGALDTASGLAVMKLFQTICKEEGVTIIMTTHDVGLMEMGDIVYEIEDGQIRNTIVHTNGI